jgi:phosphoglycerate dehydrogenase-like enzyme
MAFDTILVLWPLTDDVLARLRKTFRTVIYQPDGEPLPDETLQTVEVALMMMPPKGLLDSFSQTPKLKWIQVASAGTDRIRLTPFMKSAPSDMAVTTASGAHVGVIPPWVIMTMLSLYHKLQDYVIASKVRN